MRENKLYCVEETTLVVRAMHLEGYIVQEIG